MSFPGISAATGGTNFLLPTLTDIGGPTAFGTSHVFSGMNFGPDISGRLVCVMVYAQTKGSSVSVANNITYTNSRVGGVAMYGGDPGNNWVFEYYQGPTGNTFLIGILDAVYQPVGPTGSVTFNTSISTQCSIAIMSTTSIVNPNATITNGLAGQYAVGTSVSANVDAPSLGTLFTGGITGESGITTSFSNVPVFSQFTHIAGYTCTVGASYPVAAQTARTTTFTKTGSSKPMCIELDIWQ